MQLIRFTCSLTQQRLAAEAETALGWDEPKDMNAFLLEGSSAAMQNSYYASIIRDG